MTAKFMQKDGVPFQIVVEPQEFRQYADVFGMKNVIELPFSNLGMGSIPARNWIKKHATELGFARHWQLDDNIRQIWRRYKGIKMPCNSGPALRACEDFVDRYENVAVAGLNYYMFVPNNHKCPPFVQNVHVYSCTLVMNSIPNIWRGRYNEDTDLCLQVLSEGWCTILFNAFMAEKMTTMKMKGGNTDVLYRGDGRLKMARALERVWPGVVTTRRRFHRPQHVIKGAWRKFDTQLKIRAGVNLGGRFDHDEYGMTLTTVKDVKSQKLRGFVRELNGA